MITRRQHSLAAGLPLLIMLLPPVRNVLEASMTMQMLVQIPLLVVVGLLLQRTLPPGILARISQWNHGGITGLLLVTFAGAFWMLPRSLDAAVTEPVMAMAKYLTVPLLIGLPLVLSWPRTGFIVRGVFLSEVIATCFRLGWLYLTSPTRLCTNYLIDDQQRLGEYLLVAGGALLVWLVWKLLWGRFNSLAAQPSL
jgi:hypothetical protein